MEDSDLKDSQKKMHKPKLPPYKEWGNNYDQYHNMLGLTSYDKKLHQRSMTKQGEVIIIVEF